jgi:deoxyribodipyrimidine photo-lyase
MRTLVWFRGKDLRISDHVPLAEAVFEGEVIPLFVLDPFFFAPDAARELPHRMQFLLESLCALEQNLANLGSQLIVVAGKCVDVVPELAARFRVDRVSAHRWVEPFARTRDAIVASRLSCPLVLSEGETLCTPGQLTAGHGGAFAVYSPFARAFRARISVATPVRSPRALPPLPKDVEKTLASIATTPVPTMDILGLSNNPRLLRGGERAGLHRLRTFLKDRVSVYTEARDQMDQQGTSRLSVDLKFGTVSARTVWQEATRTLGNTDSTFHNELLWREFAHSLLWARPSLLHEPFRLEFARFPWQSRAQSAARWQAWTAGTTGYPVVDAAARQLLAEGYVHNRARMITASFLTKHLLIHYREGEAHFMKYLTDGDWAQNNAGWQWSAGCGADAQPYFRVFNPVLQGQKFDPHGGYVRKWVPELAGLPDKFVHCPWEAPPEVLRRAGITVGENYPRPIVAHKEARDRFLALASNVLKQGHSPLPKL